MIKAFPLQWPSGYIRTKERKSSSFATSPVKAYDDLSRQIELLAGEKSNAIISSNVPLRKADGKMYSDVASDEIADPGVAVYFFYKANAVVLCCDKWKTPADNVRALGLTVAALRGLDRWGVSEMLNRTFIGFKQLSQKASTRDWWEVMMINKTSNAEQIKHRYHELVKKHHPDAGGNRAEFDELQIAYQEALKSFQSASSS